MLVTCFYTYLQNYMHLNLIYYALPITYIKYYNTVHVSRVSHSVLQANERLALLIAQSTNIYKHFSHLFLGSPNQYQWQWPRG